MDCRLSGLISTRIGIYGGTDIVTISTIIEADDKFLAYSISVTFIFDIVMVILFPIIVIEFGMSDLGFGLWARTAIDYTSSIVAT